MASKIGSNSVERAKKNTGPAPPKLPFGFGSVQPKIMDPDVPSIDRTPFPFSKYSGIKSLGKRAAEFRESTVSKISRESVSRADNVSTFGEESVVEESVFLSESRVTTDSQTLQTRDSTNAESSKISEDQSGFIEQELELWTPETKKKWLDASFTIKLTESSVKMIFSQENKFLDKSTDEGKKAEAANSRYEQFCNNRVKDETFSRFNEHATTTLNIPKKSVMVYASTPPVKNSGEIYVTTWKIFDEYEKLNVDEDDDEAANDTASNNEESQIEDNTDDVEEDGDDDNNGKQKKSSWKTSTNILETVMVAERCIISTLSEDLQLAYRGLKMPLLTDNLSHNKKKIFDEKNKKEGDNYGGGFLDTQADKKKKERQLLEEQLKAEHEAQALAKAMEIKRKMRVLFKFKTDILKGKSVTCLGWNHLNKDILAVGYRDENDTTKGGVVCCWSVLNVSVPERIIYLENGCAVTALDFSKLHPNLLAVGTSDGALNIFDVKNHGGICTLKTSVSSGQHTDSIWEIKWILKRADRGEAIMTTSADGHIMEWNVKKTIERTADLMKLKRAMNFNDDQSNIVLGAKSKVQKEPLLARHSGGMTFDVYPKDSLTYVVGTEDGTLHKCSKSKNESYLLTYKPFEEPVYRIRFSSFCPEYFIACSAEWTCRLYHIDHVDPILIIDNNERDPINDIDWSPVNPTVFCSATDKGVVHIWDLSNDKSPQISLHISSKPLTSILFSRQNSPVIVAGNKSGEVTVIKLSDTQFGKMDNSFEAAQERFLSIVSKATQ